MSKKGKQNVEPNLDVESEFGDVQARDAVGIGAVVNGPGRGKQRIKTKIRSMTGDNTGLVVGAVIGDRTGKKS